MSDKQDDATENESKLTDTQIPMTVMLDQIEERSVFSDEILIYLPERKEPLSFRDKVQITIGRRDDKRGIIPDIDLTTYHGNTLGVSRKHAEIRQVKQTYYLVDMESANGTWVNETRLQPFRPRALANGDRLRLGQFVMLVQLPVSMESAETEKIATGSGRDQTQERLAVGTTIKISLPTQQRNLFMKNGVAMLFLTDFLSPYLDAFLEVHRLVRVAQDREIEPVVIETMLLDTAQKMIILQVRGGGDVIDFFQKKLVPYVEEERKAAGSSSQTFSKREDAMRASSTPEDLAERVTVHLLTLLARQMPPETYDDFVPLIAAEMRIILASDLQMNAY